LDLRRKPIALIEIVKTTKKYLELNLQGKKGMIMWRERERWV
jgi:hypothetical protein